MKKLLNLFVLCAFFVAFTAPVMAKANLELVKNSEQFLDVQSDIVRVSFDFKTSVFSESFNFVNKNYLFHSGEIPDFKNLIYLKQEKVLNLVYRKKLNAETIFDKDKKSPCKCRSNC